MFLKHFLCLTLLLSLSFLAITSPADDDGTWTYTLDDDEATILYCTRCPADLIIPDSINGYLVVAIAERAFRYSSHTSVTIPDSVTSIGEYAFPQMHRVRSLVT